MKNFLFILLIVAASLSLRAGETELLGTITREDILRAFPDWEPVAAAYSPDPGIVDRLRAVSEEVRVEIFLGTWCSDSKAHVSEYFKVMDAVDGPLYRTVYVGIPQDKSLRDPYYSGRDIQKLPTFVVTVNGREKGRIVEVPSKSIEGDLLAILEK